MAVVATADVPEPLLLARRTLVEEIGGVRLLRDWHEIGGKWALRVELSPGGLGTVHPIPDATPWYILAEARYPAGLIDIVPDAGGLTDTFPHQIPNTAITGKPYRGGKLCVATDTENNLRSDRDAEPKAAEDRLAWHVVRALEWLRRASAGTLLAPGDWFELPFYRDDNPIGVLAFREGPEDLVAWQAIPNTAGIADIIRLPGSGWFAVTAFRNLGKTVLRRPAWGEAMTGQKMPHALWVRFPEVVTLPPYRAPEDLGELRGVARAQGLDLDAALRSGTADFHDRADHLLLVGFPVPERIGEQPKQIHWQAIDLPRLERKVMNGFRPNETGWWATSLRGTLADHANLEWRKSENWHPDQLATRGRLDPTLTEQRTLLIGAGSLGSLVGELLVRAGVRDLVIADPERFAAGNLVRHTLTMANLGEYKAEALAARLRASSPNVRVDALPDAVVGPPKDPTLLDVGLVIDTTGNHEVLETLSRLAWTARPAFASLAISLHARHLFAFLSKGERFDLPAFDGAYEPFAIAERDRDEERPWEGVGCFHPVFPARADEVALMASTAVGLIEDAWPIADDTSTLHVFERFADDGDRFAGVRRVAP